MIRVLLFAVSHSARISDGAASLSSRLHVPIAAWIGCEMKSGCWYATSIIMVAVMLSIFTIGHARAHDHEHPELNSWCESLHSGKGPCCGGSDANKLRDVEWQTQNFEHSHYKVLLPAQPIINPDAPPGAMVWVDVPDEAVLTEPNKAGATLVWPLWGYQGVSVRCFMPGNMG
jgi:hypothetical protein